MPRRVTIYSLFFLSFCLLGISQKKATLELQNAVSLKADSLLAIDSYGFSYFAKNNSVVKTNFRKKIAYQNTALGSPDYLDATNPLQLILFYKRFNTVVLLDNQLNETAIVKGDLYGLLFDVVSLSRQNSFWFYDLITQKFGIFTFKENKFHFISTPFPTKIKSWNSDYNYLYWMDNAKTIHSVSFFGKITTHNTLKTPENAILITSYEYLLLNQDNLSYYTNGTMYKLNLDEKSTSNICFKGGFLAIFTDNFFTNYKIILP